MNENIKKIVELGIDLDGIDEIEMFEELGVDVISLVKSPAIEESFLYFGKEAFVDVKDEETEDEYIGRCMSELEGEFPDQDQRYAVCQTTWDEQGQTMSEEFASAVVEWAEVNGEQQTADDILIDLTKDEFSTVGEVLQGLRATDALQRLNIERDAKPEVFYRYQGNPSPQRTFCKAMMRLASQGKMFTESQINQMNGLNPAFGRRVGQTKETRYSIFEWKGGKSCKHRWQKLFLFRNSEGQRVIIVATPDTRKERTAAQTWSEMFSSRFSFKIANEEQRMVYGPVMVPNRMILRKDENGEPFYVYFSGKTIRKMAEKFLQQNKLHNTDVEHDGVVTTNNRLVESWVSDSIMHDKSYAMGFGLPKDTWYVGYRINDDETWEDIKAGRITGFSLAGQFLDRYTQG